MDGTNRQKELKGRRERTAPGAIATSRSGVHWLGWLSAEHNLRRVAMKVMLGQIRSWMTIWRRLSFSSA